MKIEASLEYLKLGNHYVFSDPNHYFFTDVHQILEYVKNRLPYDTDLIMRLENTIKENYNMSKPKITEIENQIKLLEEFPYEIMYVGSLDQLKAQSVVLLKHINKKINELRNQLIKESK